VNVTFWDKISSFSVWTDEKGGHYEYHDTELGSKKGHLSNSNFDFLMDQASTIKGENSNDVSFCGRANMSLSFPKEKQSIEKVACIGSQTSISMKITEFVNTLRLLL
jgi:hypothetical protein